MEVPIYPIGFKGYRGTIEISDGTLRLELDKTIAPGAMSNGSFPVKRYFLSLLTPDRENIEFELYRVLHGEWFDWHFFGISEFSDVTSELKHAAKLEIERMKL